MRRRDPRAEPSDPPPIAEEHVSARFELPKAERREEEAEPPPSSRRQPPPPAPEAQPHAVITNVDPRLEQVEPLVDKADWQGIAKALGGVAEIGQLPPNLGLLAALAASESAGEKGAPVANETAIRCMAGLFGVAPESAIARVLAKRLLRKNPTTWRERPAPPARVSFLIILVVLVLGGALGWFLSSGYVKWHR